MLVFIVLLAFVADLSRLKEWPVCTPFDSWRDSARYALVMFIFTATAHFNKMKHDLAHMIPSSFPRPLLIVYTTGFLELLGAAG
jgi:hypothetical protein